MGTTSLGLRYPDSSANFRPSTDLQNLAVDVNTLVQVLFGLPAPTTSAQGGTVTSGSTSTRDDVLGVYTLTVPSAAATWRFEAYLTSRVPNFTASGDIVAFEIRDGGGSVPTSTSPLVAIAQLRAQATGGAGQETLSVRDTWVPGVGTHTLAAFTRRVNGTGTITPVPAGPDSKLGARFCAFG